MSILVTGGAGYIGSHLVKMLYDNGMDVIVFDNLSRGHKEAVPAGIVFENVDLLDPGKLLSKLKLYHVDSIVHFAAFAYVGESVEKPELYYENNVVGSFNLIRAANECGIKKVIFSSTCSLYGNPEIIPISESAKVQPINPYAKTKLVIENILRDFDSAYGMKHISLRYFNAAGADPSGKIGESHDPEPHLIPIILQTVQGKREKVFIFGDDYNTPDGTCIRDYIHVNDLADAHVKALEYLSRENKSDFINIGTGEGNSVLEVISTTENVTGNKVKYEIIGRREGDPAVLVADNKKAQEVFGWSPKFKLTDIINHSWNWHQNQKY